MVRAKVRMRFRKTGEVRLISHHDLLRCFERSLRRAEIPFHSTAGFNPKPRLVFAMPLPLGIPGEDEVVELELTDDLPTEDLKARLAGQLPTGIEIVSVERIDWKSTAHVRSVRYRLAVPPERTHILPERIVALLAAPTCWIERSRPRYRRVDVRPYLADIHLLAEAIEMSLLVTPGGAARPEEIVELLGLGDLLEAGAVLERTCMELEEERPAAVPAATPSETTGLGPNTYWPDGGAQNTVL